MKNKHKMKIDSNFNQKFNLILHFYSFSLKHPFNIRKLQGNNHTDSLIRDNICKIALRWVIHLILLHL